MGFLGRSRRLDPEPIPPDVEAVLYSHSENRTYLEKLVRANLAGINETLLPGETLRMVTKGSWDSVGVLTADRCFAVRKGKLEAGPFSWHEIEEVKLGKLERNGGTYVIWLFTESFRLDYRDDDPAKYTQKIEFEGRVERDIQTVASLVRELRGV